MTTLAEFMIIAGADNRPPMLEKSLYESWKNHMELYIENQENGRMILNSLQNGPLVWTTVVEEDDTTRTKKYEELSVAEELQADFAKEIWDRVKLLMQGTKLSLQEKECKLYDEFDKLSFVKDETLYHLPPEWGKFVTNVKLARDLHTMNYDQLSCYSCFKQGDDPIACLNKAMDFLIAVASSSYAGNIYKGNATNSGGNNAGGQAKVVKCYNYQGEGHMARQCTQPKRPRNDAWLKEKAMLAKAQKARQILDEEKLAFLADPGIPDSKAAQTTIPNTAAFQTQDLDAYDSDCDDVSNAKAVLMANVSNYGSDVILEVPYFEPYHTDMDNQSVHEMQGFEQTSVADFTDNEITNSMILSVIKQMPEQMINHVNNWEKANQEKINESVTVELERYKERVKIFEQRLNIDLSTREKMIDSQIDDMIKEKLALKQ
ncbi:ubiquitin carboxyl-terminal hydrolase 12-like protein [Tanacetum coccineum]|uniref:Ubiquitin carboxyl-terminal hydrolase 12-like protein n=1 Tax=Tanacetum coccineum TaxID=301880 RepID=A0ABQ5C4L7_9ASTR